LISSNGMVDVPAASSSRALDRRLLLGRDLLVLERGIFEAADQRAVALDRQGQR
jgi:hypothetical protein